MNTTVKIRKQARENVVAALQTGDSYASDYSATSSLADAIGQKNASELVSNRYRAIHDLLSVRDDMTRLGERIQREVASAVEYVGGGAASFNSLGVLQADGSRFDGYCMVFPIRVEQAIEAEFAILKALAGDDES
jgi:hypothetical protein